MRNRIKNRKRKIKVILIVVIILISSLICVMLVKKNENANYKSEYDIKLENDLNIVKEEAFKAWKIAKTSGKNEDEEIQQFVIERLNSSNIKTDNYYITVQDGKINVILKNKSFLVEAGYYKANTNLNEKLTTWEQLVNKRIINVVDGRLGYLKSESKDEIDIIVSNEIKEMKEKVFKENINVSFLHIPNSVEKVATNTFENLQFKEIVFVANIDTIDSLFVNNTRLEKITFTNNIKFIKGQTFRNCNIKEVNYEGSIEDLASTLYFTYYDAPNHSKNCKLYIQGVLVEDIRIPEGVKQIEQYTFMNYTNINKIKLPSTLESIGTAAFEGGNKKEIIYNGTKEMWEKVLKSEEWISGNMECVVYCTDGNIIYEKGVK